MNDADIGAAARLLEVLGREYFLGTCSPGQADAFVRENDAQALRRLVADGYVYHLAEIDGALAGFIGMRERRHVYHLFVAKECQRRGVGRRLWEHARQVAMQGGADGVFTVNASNYAVPMYESLGFVRAAAMQTKNGLAFNPMIFGQSLGPFVGAP
ncbi:GNAT family N-acetyltransferase [Massilia soli]|nr:GNAT family N-acetyltransferase [Massilia soli]